MFERVNELNYLCSAFLALQKVHSLLIV